MTILEGMKAQNKNEALMEAISYHNIKAVEELLQLGADPNYTRHQDEEEPNGILHPTTPLRMVLFCISDSFLEDEDLKQFSTLATLLLNHGADPKPALQLAEHRYGKYDPKFESSPFMDVWHIVANAK